MKPENYSLLRNRLDFYLASKNTEPQMLDFIENNLNDCIRKNQGCYQEALEDITGYHESLIFCLDSLVIQTDTVPDSEKVNLLLLRILDYIKSDRKFCKSFLVSKEFLDSSIYKAKYDLLLSLYHDIRHFFSLSRHPSVFFFDHKDNGFDHSRRISASNHIFYSPILFHRMSESISMSLFNRKLEKERQGRYWRT